LKTEIIKTDPLHPEKEIIRKAARLLRSGELVIFPTETVYGLGADGSSPEALEKIFRIKGRPRDKPLTRLIGDWSELKSVIWQSGHLALAKRFWPGPLTLIVELSDGSRCGIRFPDHALTRGLIRESAVSLVATSANVSGRPAAFTAVEAGEQFFGRVALIIDGGPAPGTSSTVLDLTTFPEELLRSGMITGEQIESCLGHAIA